MANATQEIEGRSLIAGLLQGAAHKEQGFGIGRIDRQHRPAKTVGFLQTALTHRETRLSQPKTYPTRAYVDVCH